MTNSAHNSSVLETDTIKKGTGQPESDIKVDSGQNKQASVATNM